MRLNLQVTYLFDIFLNLTSSCFVPKPNESATVSHVNNNPKVLISEMFLSSGFILKDVASPAPSKLMLEGEAVRHSLNIWEMFLPPPADGVKSVYSLRGEKRGRVKSCLLLLGFKPRLSPAAPSWRPSHLHLLCDGGTARLRSQAACSEPFVQLRETMFSRRDAWKFVYKPEIQIIDNNCSILMIF